MPRPPFTIFALTLLMGLFLQAETLSEFKTRLVAEGLINSAGEVTAVIDLGSHETATGQRPLSEVRFRVTLTTKDGGLSPGSYRVLVFDLDDPDDESVHDSDASQRNYVEILDSAAQISRGRAAIAAMIAGSVPIPAVPTAQLPFQVMDENWAGQTIEKYKWPEQQQVVDDGAVTAANIVLFLSTSGRQKVRISVDAATGFFVVEPVESL